MVLSSSGKDIAECRHLETLPGLASGNPPFPPKLGGSARHLRCGAIRRLFIARAPSIDHRLSTMLVSLRPAVYSRDILYSIIAPTRFFAIAESRFKFGSSCSTPSPQLRGRREPKELNKHPRQYSE